MSLRSRALACLFGAALAACAGERVPAPLLHTIVDGRTSMGTVLEISLVARDRDKARERIAAEYRQVALLEAIVSRHLPDSQLSQLNRSAGEAPMPVDPRLGELIEQSIEFGGLTDGSFDVTVGPLIELWQSASQRDRLPTQEELDAARDLVGFRKIVLEPGAVGLERRGMSIDLGGIAKGYALDLMADRLREQGHTNALLSFGLSSVWAIGAPPTDFGWRLLLRPPSKRHELGVITLRDQALSVSSSLGQWSEIEGVRYGHVIDPRSGRAVTTTRRATVVADTASEAEALSTALVVLDPREGLALVEARDGAEARIDDETGFVGQTSGFQKVTRYRGVLEPQPPAGEAAQTNDR